MLVHIHSCIRFFIFYLSSKLYNDIVWTPKKKKTKGIVLLHLFSVEWNDLMNSNSLLFIVYAKISMGQNVNIVGLWWEVRLGLPPTLTKPSPSPSCLTAENFSAFSDLFPFGIVNKLLLFFLGPNLSNFQLVFLI